MSKSRMQQGFTLIELIVVIVILGILAATALPKFVDLSSDARKSVLEGIKGSAASAANMAYGKAAAQGKDLSAASGQAISVGTATVDLVYGYPAATLANGIHELMQTDSSVAYTAGRWTLQTNCYVTYTASTGPGVPPVINATANTGGC